MRNRRAERNPIGALLVDKHSAIKTWDRVLANVKAGIIDHYSISSAMERLNTLDKIAIEQGQYNLIGL